MSVIAYDKNMLQSTEAPVTSLRISNRPEILFRTREYIRIRSYFMEWIAGVHQKSPVPPYVRVERARLLTRHFTASVRIYGQMHRGRVGDAPLTQEGLQWAMSQTQASYRAWLASEASRASVAA